MSSNDKFNKSEDLDSFWDIEELIPLPKERKSKPLPRFDTSPVNIISHAPSTPHKKESVKSEKLSVSEFKRFIPPFNEKDIEDQPKPDIEYLRENSLITTVKIYNWKSKYAFHERFTDDAARLWKKKGEPAPLVPFFSYSPQYAQLNRDQLAYYFWWRENVREGIYLDTDYSYVLLYLYELINLSDTLDRQYCLDQLVNVWLNYGEKHVFLGRYLSEWVCDFCLINNMPAPAERLKKVYPQIMKDCTLKEFYALCQDGGNRVCAKTLMNIPGAYDFKKSKYANEQRIPIMEKYLTSALRYVLKKFSDKLVSGVVTSKSRVIRSSYTGALCTAHIKRRIEVEYYSLNHSYELRYLVNDILKYSENKLRQAWGIKSRLSIYALPTEIKKCLDDYFELIVANEKKERASIDCAKKSDAEKEYEKRYAVPKTPFSVENANNIENASWSTTKLLVEAFENENEKHEEFFKSVSKETTCEKSQADLRSTLGERYDFLLAIMNEDIVKQRELSAKLGILSEAIVNEINEIAFDMLGDVLIEDDGEKYTIIEEYKNLILS